MARPGLAGDPPGGFDGSIRVRRLPGHDGHRRDPAGPELLLPIKVQVDNDARPGRYLLSGSARVLGLRALPDTLPGRMETIELWPFSQGEIDEAPDGLIDAIFAHGADLRHASQVSRAEYADRIVRGGFPEAIARSSPRRRERFHDSYVADLVARDVMQLSDIE